MLELKPKRIEKLISIDAMFLGINATRPKDFFFAGEMHDFWEAVFVENGNAVATADERLYKLDAGKLLFHKPMEFHRIWSDNQSSPHLLIISFRASGEGMKRFENGFFDLNYDEREQFSKITAQFMKAAKLYNEESSDFAFSSSMAAALLETFLLQLYAKDTISLSKLSWDERQYCNIVNVMKENCEKNLSVSEIAELCQMGESNLKRVFSIYCDVGPAKYFLGLKMRRAMELLEEGHSAVSVSKALGFNEIGYFYTVFKRETGKTLSQFKKSK